MTARGAVACMALVCLAALAPAVTRAGDGRREISQASILAGGGYPYVISAPGSYVLTGDLAPADNLIAIQINADDVDIDLNGFAIRGNLVCTPGSCTGTGPSAGISVPTSPVTNGRRCAVRNGKISGINGSAINLREEAFVDAVSVSNTGFHAIILGPRSLATRNRVTSAGRSGLFLGPGSGYGQNVIANTGLFFAFGSVNGGKPVGGNVCDDGRCPGARRFYLSQAAVTGPEALSQCDAGFHMASRWEIQNLNGVRYDLMRGFTTPDQGEGPPTLAQGWVRTGGSGASVTVVGLANCNVWQDTSGSGTVMEFVGTETAAEVHGWSFGTGACNSVFRVWCVEDD